VIRHPDFKAQQSNCVSMPGRTLLGPIKLYHDRPIYTLQSKIDCAGEYDARPRLTPFWEQH
ncbi:hypothetical protein NRY67_06305, partial [Acidithiobacillus ferrooxidans]|uniref:hypothetical protein n=1 Tax=Acidithiobacillus ferrooxidans TaxID=920 RepID=UPI0021474014